MERRSFLCVAAGAIFFARDLDEIAGRYTCELITDKGILRSDEIVAEVIEDCARVVGVFNIKETLIVKQARMLRDGQLVGHSLHEEYHVIRGDIFRLYW